MKALEKYLSNHKKTDIIFDFDATIFELLLPWEDHFKHIRDELTALDAKIYKNYVSGKVDDVVTQLRFLEKYGDRAKKIFDRNSLIFESKYLRGVRKNHDPVDFIKHDNKYKKHIWSSNSRLSVENVLKEHDLLEKFEKIVTRELVEIIKPYTFGFKHIHDKKTPLEKFLFVGDSQNDEGAAMALGIDFFKVKF